MKKKLFIGVAAGALALTGVGFYVGETGGRHAGDALATQATPFLHPLIMARALCGDDDAALSKKRAFFVNAARAYAETTPKTANAPEMLRTDLGAISYDVTTASPHAQAWFNQGLAHTQNFNHGEAINAFKKAQELDPECAMCFWGEAFAHGPNINAPMADEAAGPAYAAIEKAMALRDKASNKERALINALNYRYSKAPPKDRAKLDHAFADAMRDVVDQYPDDDLIATLAAEANMDMQPWDYWEAGGREPKGRTVETISLLEGVLARNPDHAAAIHLYIHITEASRDPYRAASYADRLADLAPGLGHLTHMPSHTYYRIGRFKESLAHNIRAVAIDQRYLNDADASILYEYGYFTHNIHFAMTSAQMAGDGETALAMALKLDEKLPLDMAAAAPWVQPIKAAPYYAMAQFADPAAILALEDPGDALPFLKGAWHYARGEAFARNGDIEKANAEVAAISTLIAETDFSGLVEGGVPVIDVLNIARLTVIARAAAAEGDYASAVEAMEDATALQEGLAYTEPPFWYYPAKQTLAAMVLRQGDAERAEQLFLESLAASPNNAWVLYGLSEAYKAQGDKSGSKYAKALYKDAWLGGKKAKLSLSHL